MAKEEGDESKDASLDFLREVLAREQEGEEFTLQEYRDALSGVPAPTDEQIAGFATFVCDAHSWYKHLPLLPPGIPFLFFLDPYAGYDLIRESGGSVCYRERGEGEKGFHYTWMPTAEYRRRFDHLQYETSAGPRFLTASSGGMLEVSQAVPGLLASDGTAFRVPPEILRAGTVELTGVIHRLAARGWVWDMFAGPDRQWPEETGGRATLDRIRLRCQQLRGHHRSRDGVDSELERLLEPERRRLVAGMVEAMKRVRSVVFG